MLDIEVAGALAPGATIAVYFTANTDQGFYEAISQAAHDTTNKPSVISISWGGPEDSWNSASLTAMESALQDAAALGVTVTVAAGDNGSSDGESDGQPHVDFPASSPYALACGGTTLNARGTTIQSEVVWNETASNDGATGGGVSIEFDLPTWQQNANVPESPSGNAGRGVPDVAGNADPVTGYQVLVDGQIASDRRHQRGGAAMGRADRAPQSEAGYAGGRCARCALPDRRKPPSAISRKETTARIRPGPGWDACTGLGSPNGQALLNALSALKT